MSDLEELMIKIELSKPWNKKISSEEIKKLYVYSLKFMEFTKISNDIRFFNTSLKINDFLRQQNKILKINEIETINLLEKEILNIIKEMIIK